MKDSRDTYKSLILPLQSERPPETQGVETHRNFVPNLEMPVAFASNETASRNFTNEQCIQFKMGHCSYGEKCKFVHGKPWQGNGENEKLAAGSKQCREWASGRCSYGEACRFLHVNPERVGESSAAIVGNTRPEFWKTRLCSRWEMTGGCSYGENCRFAHGQAELMNLGSQNAHFPAVMTKTEPRIHAQGMKVEPRSKKLNGIYADWIEGLSPRA